MMDKGDLVDQMLGYFSIRKFQPIVQWAQEYIDFRKDVSAQRSRLSFDDYPYQVDVVRQWQDLTGGKTVCFLCPEQMR